MARRARASAALELQRLMGAKITEKQAQIVEGEGGERVSGAKALAQVLLHKALCGDTTAVKLVCQMMDKQQEDAEAVEITLRVQSGDEV